MSVYELHSPGKKVSLQLTLEEGRLRYGVEAEGVCAVAPSPLGIVTDLGDFTCGLSAVEAKYGTVDETYRIPAFKKDVCVNRANTLTLVLEKDGRQVCAEVRAYDDGAAVRMTVCGAGPVAVLREGIGYGIPEQAGNIYAQRYIFTYEDHYQPVPRSELWQNAYAFPMLVQLPGGKWALYAEAGVFGGEYGGANLCASREEPSMLMVCKAPDELTPITGTLPLETPWRAVMVGGIGDIVESNLLENLNPPSILEDDSFIRPGRSAWSWMTENHSAADEKRQRDYVDYAAAMGFEYSLVDGGWPGHVDIPALVAYADARNVKLWVWEHSGALDDPQVAEEKLRLWAGWGVVGVKIDFFESDAQKRIARYRMLAELAARYRLMLNFHGCSKPTGSSRVWPHVLAYEGIMGGEYLQNFSTFLPGGPDAAHNCTLPFTRCAVGPADYTPVVYRTYQTGASDAHQTALTVVLTGYVLHIGERDDVVMENVCRPFLSAVPTVWDETRLLEGEPANHVTMARRSGRDWFVGGICARRPRSAVFSLDFLEEGAYEMELYADDLSGDTVFDASVGARPAPTAEDCAAIDAMSMRTTLHAHDMHAVRVEKKTVCAGETLSIPLCANGGFAMILRAK